MIPLLVLLCAAQARAASLVDLTLGAVGRNEPAIEGSERAQDLVDALRWEEAAKAWGLVAEGSGRTAEQVSYARLWQAVSWTKAGALPSALTVLAEDRDSATHNQALLTASWVLLEEGEERTALRLLKRIPEDDPDAVGATVLQMRAHALAGRPERARRIRDRAASEGRTDAWFWIEAGLQDARLDPERATSSFERALRAEGVTALHHRILVRHLAASQARVEAARYAHQAALLYPDDRKLSVGLATDLFRVGMVRAGWEQLVLWRLHHPEDTEIAGEVLGRLASDEPPALLLGMASELAFGGGRLEEALLLAERYTLLYAEIARGYELKGMALWALGRRDEAFQTLEEAMVHDPDARLLNNYAWYLLQEGRDPGYALQLALRSVDAGGEPVAARLDTLAAALWANGQREEALQTQRRAVELEPDNPALVDTLQSYEARLDSEDGGPPEVRP